MFKIYFFAIFLFWLPSYAFADPIVKINDVDITGVRGQTFKDVTVVIDDKGNINIIAPQYHVKRATIKTDDNSVHRIEDSVPTLTHTNTLPDFSTPTWMVAEFNYPSLFGYDINVIINGKAAKTITQDNSSFTQDISNWLVHGKNIIEYRLVMSADAGSYSKSKVDLYLSKQVKKGNGTVELSGQYAPVQIRNADGARSYKIEVIVP